MRTGHRFAVSGWALDFVSIACARGTNRVKKSEMDYLSVPIIAS
jgi:hypothetical protein